MDEKCVKECDGIKVEGSGSESEELGEAMVGPLGPIATLIACKVELHGQEESGDAVAGPSGLVANPDFPIQSRIGAGRSSSRAGLAAEARLASAMAGSACSGRGRGRGRGRGSKPVGKGMGLAVETKLVSTAAGPARKGSSAETKSVSAMADPASKRVKKNFGTNWWLRKKSSARAGPQEAPKALL